MPELNKILPFATEPVQLAATPLIQGVQKLSADFQLERSLKILPQGIYWNRFLIAMDARSISLDKFNAYAHEIGMPPALLTSMAEQLADANTLLAGFEQQDNRTIYKLYLEFWNQVVHKVRSTNSKDPQLLNLGFKWDRDDKAYSTITHYYCYPLLTVNHILERIAAIFESREAALYTAVKTVILQAARKVAHPSFTYMEGSESNQRRSFDLNLYQSDLSLSDIPGDLDTIARLIAGEQTDCANQLMQYAACTLGHISGGYDRQGMPFITIYYED